MSRSAPSPINPDDLSFTPTPRALQTPTLIPKRSSSLLPISTPSKASFSLKSPRTVTPSFSYPSPSLACDSSKLKPTDIYVSNVAPNSSSMSQIKPREGNARISKLTARKMSPQASFQLNPTVPNSSLQKPTQVPSYLEVTRKPTDELAADEQAERSHILFPAAIPHSLRRIPRLQRQGILNNTRTQALSTASMLNVEPSFAASWRPAGPKAVSPQLNHQQPNYSINRGLTPPRQARKAKSQQELLPKSRFPHSKVVSAQFSTPVKQSSIHSESTSTSPESLQSNITLTDGDLIIPTRLDYGHKPISIGDSKCDSIQKIASTSSSNVVRRATDVLIPPPITHNSPSTSDHRVPPEAKPRLMIVEKLKSLITTNESYQNTISFQAVYRLICQTNQYETQQDIEKRLLENATIFIPQATLEVPIELSTPQSSYPPTTSSSILTTQPPVYGVGPSKKSHVGAIILDKLRWVSKNGAGQSFKHGPSKSLSKPVKISSLSTGHPSNKSKYANFDHTVNQEQHRFSQVLGVGLESMHYSTCVVTMGGRLHILPTLPYSVIEEIYRRGMRTPGILRISGDFTRIDELVKTFESCPSSGIDLSSEDIHTLCGLLKYYLRSLPQPLFHPLLSDIFWQLCVNPNRTKHSNVENDTSTLEFIIARYLLQLIPSRALSLLAYVVPFLAHVPTFSENRIQYESLATMLGPAIFVNRNIGFPGLGLHSRSNKMSRSAIRKGSASQVTEDLFPTNPSQMDKNEASERAAESTLWMMNHWESLFSEVYKVSGSEIAGIDPAETPEERSKSVVQQQHGSFQDHTQLHPQQLNAILSERFIGSRPSSILTYSSGLTGSLRSTVIEPSNRSLSPIPSPVHSSKMSDIAELEFTSQDNIRSDSGKDLKQPEMRSSLALDFLCSPKSKEVQLSPLKEDPESNQSQPTKEDKEYRFKQSPLALIKHSVQDEDKRERRNSERLTKLLAEYIEAREEKITQQESLIESLIKEIGRMNIQDEEGEKEKRKSMLEKMRCNSIPSTNSGEQPLKKIKDYLNAIDGQASNIVSDSSPSNFRQNVDGTHALKKNENYSGASNHSASARLSSLESAVTTSSDHPSSSNAKFNQNLDGHVRKPRLNFDDCIESDKSHECREDEGDSTQFEKGSNKPNNPFNDNSQGSRSGVTFAKNPFDSPQSPFGSTRPQEEPFKTSKDGNQIDTRRLSCEPRNSILDDKRLSVDTKHLSSVSCSSASFACGETEAFKAEINRLRLINSKLALKLQFIESILSTGISDMML